jgi:hypothetical protein
MSTAPGSTQFGGYADHVIKKPAGYTNGLHNRLAIPADFHVVKSRWLTAPLMMKRQ